MWGPLQVVMFLAVSISAVLLSIASQAFALLTVGLVHMVALCSASLEAASNHLSSGGARSLTWSGIVGRSREAGFQPALHDELRRQIRSLKKQSRQLRCGLARASSVSRRHLAVVGRSLHQKSLLGAANERLEQQIQNLRQDLLRESAKQVQHRLSPQALKAQQELHARVTALEKQQATLAKDNEELLTSKAALEEEVEALEGWVRGEVEEKAQTQKRLVELQAHNTDLAYLNEAMEDWIEGKDTHIKQLISENTGLFAQLSARNSTSNGGGTSSNATPVTTPRLGDGPSPEGKENGGHAHLLGAEGQKGFALAKGETAFAFMPHTPEQAAQPPASTLWQSPAADVARAPLEELKRRFSERFKDSSLSQNNSLSAALSPAMTIGPRSASFSPAASAAADLLARIDMSRSQHSSQDPLLLEEEDEQQCVEGRAQPGSETWVGQDEQTPTDFNNREWEVASSPPRDGLQEADYATQDEEVWRDQPVSSREWSAPLSKRDTSSRSGNFSEGGYEDAASITYTDEEEQDEDGYGTQEKAVAWRLATEQLAQEQEEKLREAGSVSPQKIPSSSSSNPNRLPNGKLQNEGVKQVGGPVGDAGKEKGDHDVHISSSSLSQWGVEEGLKERRGEREVEAQMPDGIKHMVRVLAT